MKKMLACLLCMAMVLSMAVCGMTADAAETPEKSGKSVTYGGITYDIYKDHAEVTKVDLDVYTGYNPEYAENKVFAFPKEIQYQETGEIKPVTALRYNDCYRNFSAKKIIIPSSVTTCKIGFGNYTPNEVLEEVTFENGSQLKRLYGSIFWNCVALNRVGIAAVRQHKTVLVVPKGHFISFTVIQPF